MVVGEHDLFNFMIYRKNNNEQKPLSVIQVNNSFILAIYRGAKSPADIVIRYRQKLKNDRWSNIRTPKHIHWVVDVLLKLALDRETTVFFLNELLRIWYEEIKPLEPKERDNLDLKQLLEYDREIIEKYKELSRYGEYSIKFLYLLAKLLMIQEKTNYPEGKIFQKIIMELMEGKDLFSIIQKATLK